MSMDIVPIGRNTVDTVRPPMTAWVDLVQPAADLATQIAGTEFVPTEMRNKTAMITACILYGAEIGIGPMMSLAKIDIVKGRPAPRSELGRALFLGAGHSMWTIEQNNTRVTVAGHRRGDPSHVMTVTWSMDDVKKAGISNANYQRYPRQMLYARASIELVRQIAADALGGITVFAEEADDLDPPTMPMSNGAPAPAAVEAPVKATTTRRRAPAAPAGTPPAEPPAAPPHVDAALPELPGDEPANGITDDQIKKMMASFNELGIRERDDRLAFIAAATRPVESSKDLTITEASTVIDALIKLGDGEMRLVYNDDGTNTLTAIDQP